MNEGLEVSSHGILEARTTFEVAVESIRDVEDALDVLHAQRLFVVHCQRLSGADCVFDLFTVRKHTGKYGKGSIPGDRSSYVLPVRCNQLR